MEGQKKAYLGDSVNCVCYSSKYQLESHNLQFKDLFNAPTISTNKLSATFTEHLCTLYRAPGNTMKAVTEMYFSALIPLSYCGHHAVWSLTQTCM